jgi:hypothetical protein
MSYTISMNGVALDYLPIYSNYSRGLTNIGGTARSITGSLVDLGVARKRTWSLAVVIGAQASWLEGLMDLASFAFVDHDGSTFTVKMTGLMENQWPLSIVGTAQITLEEV